MDIELLISLLLLALIAFGLLLAAGYTIRTRAASPAVPQGRARGPFRHVVAVVVWLVFFGFSAFLAWADGADFKAAPEDLIAVSFVGLFFIVPVWRATDRFQGKPWDRRMTADFAVSASTLVFSGWGLIQLAFRDAESLHVRFLDTAFAVVLFALGFPVVVRWFARRADR
jgi:hypothetical protein